MEFYFYFRHRVGHRHIIIIVLTPLELAQNIDPRKLLEEKLPNIFQKEYIEGLDLLEIKKV